MGGKSSPQAAPAPVMPPMQDNSAQIAQMMSMMGMMMQNMPQAPAIPELPQINREPVIDWSERHDQLLAKTKADYDNELASKKGRSSTILTSPMLDEEDPDTTQSLLTGSKAK
jgi:cell envelope opacity-associated protein A